MMLVSFVIPAHNAAATLKKAIQSLQAQTVGNWEAIIVDDGSTDDTLLIAKRLATGDTRLRVFTQAQGGPSAARNAGIDAVRGDALVFLDADDWLLPAYLERMLAPLAADPSLDAVHCGHYIVTPDGRRGPDVFPWWSSDLFEELSRRCVFNMHNCLVRRAVVSAVGHFDVSLPVAQDWDFWQRLARTGARFGAVREALACYLVRPGSASSNARQMLIDGLTIIERGHQADPRVSFPAEHYAAGIPGGEAPRAKLYYTCWVAGLALGQGQDARLLLASVPDEGVRELSPPLVADFLFDAIPAPLGRLHADWGELWPVVAPGIDAFLAVLEVRLPQTKLAQRVKEILQARADAIISDGHPQSSAVATDDMADRERHQRHLAELEEARDWLEQQVASWQGAVAERDQQIQSLKAWIGELEAGKAWLETQRQNWMRLAEEREQQLRRSRPLALPRWLRPKLWRAPAPPTLPAQPVDAPAAEALTTIANPEPAVRATHEPETAATPEPAPGSSPFANPRHVIPLSREWGYDRGLPIDRYYIEGFLARCAEDVQGRVMEVGDNNYTKRFGGERVRQSDVLNFATENPQTTLVGDLAHGDHLPSEAFDCIILTQTLQFIYDARAALKSLERMLKPGGVLLLTCPGLTRTSQTEWPGSWYWRFTPALLSRMLAETVPGLQVDVESHGNALAASAFLFGLAVEELSPAELDYEDTDYDVILTVRGVKHGSHLQNMADKRGVTEPQYEGFSPTHQSTALYSGDALEPTPALVGGLVLLYHRVATIDVDPWSVAVTPARFAEHLALIKRTFQPVQLEGLAQALEHPTRGRPPVAVTFDDGYADNLYAALPLLEQNGVPATFFITTRNITKHAEFWWDTLERLWLWPGTLPSVLRLTVDGQSHEWQLGEWAHYSETARDTHRNWRAWQAPPTPRHAAFTALWELLHSLHPEVLRPLIAQMQTWAGLAAEPRQRVLDLDELLCLARSEVADFGAHTVTHPSLAVLPLAEQRAEIEKSKRWLTDVLERPVRNLSYPFGKLVDYGPDAVTLARTAGFERAYTNMAGAVKPGTDPFQLPRLYVQDWDGETFERELRRWLDW